MSKNYIYQLSGGKMLVFQDGWVGVEETGYPLPDCALTVNGKVLKKQQDIMRAILGYDVENAQAFASYVAGIQPMLFDEFKHKIIIENIGGGCSQRMQAIQRAVHDQKLARNVALFKYTLPLACIDEDCILPAEDALVEEYGDILNTNWVTHVNTPNWKFKNNLIMLTGCREVTDKHIAFAQDVAAICMLHTEKLKYHYLCGVTLSNGNGAIILTDSYINNCDLAYLYQKVTGADLSVGKIDGVFHKEDGSFSMKFEYVEDVGKKRKMPTMTGVVKRYKLW